MAGQLVPAGTSPTENRVFIAETSNELRCQISEAFWTSLSRA